MSLRGYLTKRADELVRGDYLPATKSTVQSVNVTGLSVPTGKVELTIRDVKGRVRIKHWNRATRVSFESPATK